MISDNMQSIAQRAKAIYNSELQKKLESEYRDKYVAIEPDSGDYFVGDTYGESVRASRQAHPSHIAFVIRIGHTAAIHLGAITN